MDRSKNNFFILLIISFSIFACSPQKSPEQLLSEAEAQISNQKHSLAIITLKNILKSNPKMAKARYALAEAYFLVGQLQSAEKEINRAIEYGYSINIAKLFLAKIYSEQSENDDVIEILETLSFEDKDLESVKLLLLGKAFLGRGDIGKASEFIFLVDEITPNSGNSYYGKALLAVMNKNYIKAIELIDLSLKIQPLNNDGWLIKAKLSENDGNFPEAELAYKHYLKSRPSNNDVKLLLAHAYIQQKKTADAESLLDSLLKLNTQHPTTNLLKAKLSYISKDYKKVKLHSETVLINQPNQPLALFLSGFSNYFLNNYEQAYSHLKKITPVIPEEHDAHKILMLTMAQLKLTDELSEYINSYDSFDKDDSSLLNTLASELTKQGDIDSAENIFKKVTELKPDDVDAKKRLGITRMFNNNIQGLIDLEEIYTLNSSDETVSRILAYTYYKQKNYTKASEAINALLIKIPEDIDGLLLKAKIEYVDGKIENSSETIGFAFNLAPNNPKVLLIVAEDNIKKKNYNKAEEVLKKIISINQNIKNSYKYLHLISKIRNQSSDFFNYLKEVVKKHNEALWPKIFLAQEAIAKKDADVAIKILPTFQKDDLLPEAYYSTMLDSYSMLGNENKVNEIASFWQSINSASVIAYLKHIEILEKKSDITQALEITNRGISKVNNDTDKLRLSLLKARYSLQLGFITEAQATIEFLVGKIPNNFLVLQLSGHLALLKGDLDTAIEQLKLSYNTQPNIIAAILLTNVYKKKGQSKELIDFLENLSEGIFKTTQIQTVLAEAYISSSPKKSISIYTSLLQNTPNNILVLNNLAWLLVEERDYEKALKHAIKAQELAPKNPDVLDTLGIIFLKKDNVAKAIEVFEEAVNYSKQPMLLIHYSKALLANGQKEKADAVINELSSSDKVKYAAEIKSDNKTN